MPDHPMFDALLIGLVTIDESGVIHAFNRAASGIFGYSAEEALGANVRMLMPEPYRSEHDDYVGLYLTSNEAKILGRPREVAARRKDGAVFACELGVVEIAPDQAVGRRFAATLRDISAEKDNERKLIAARGAAERANKTKTQFLANMSHELRTPLNAIIGYSEMLKEDAEEKDLPEFVADLDRIRSAGHHLLEMINSVLEVSKIESGQMEISLEGFDVEQVVRGVLDSVRPQSEKAGNTLIVNLAYDLGSMVADRMKVWQSLANLLSNACKFTKDGTIEIQVHRYRENELGPDGVPQERSWIAFQVRDTGIGISPEQLDGLFRAFAQADPSTTRKYGGTGLGLVISEKFCKLMGGRIEAESELGEGSTFTLRLPAEVVKKRYRVTDTGGVHTDVTAVMQVQRERIEAELEGPKGARAVLIIEDDLALTKLISRSLESLGLRIKSTRSGQEGLQLAEVLQPCAIVLDTALPDMQGWSVLARIKDRRELADIPVVLISVGSDGKKGMALGATDFLQKPFPLERLTSILRRVTPGVEGGSAERGDILLVDDDTSGRKLIGRLLERAELSWREAADGAEAIQRIEESEPGLILLDLMMPEVDGFGVIEWIKRTGRERIPVVVLTAKELTAEDQARLDGRVQDVVQKGALTPEDLATEVSRLVQMRIPIEHTASLQVGGGGTP